MNTITQSIPCYIGSKQRATSETRDVIYPYDGSVVATVCMADEQQMDAAIQAAYDARDAMRRLEVHERVQILQYIVRELTARTDEFARLLVQENGKTITEARGEVGRAITTFHLAIGELEQGQDEAMDMTINAASTGRYGIVRQMPIGVVSCIVPFNFPLNLAAHKIAPAIAAGCPFVVKPASATPLSMLAFGEILAASGLPDGSWSIVPCSRQVGQQLVTDERIALLSFTGSPYVGRQMKADAGKKKVILELGGNAACIIDHGVDVTDAMIDRIITGAYYQAGQSCISVQRIYVHASQYDDLTARLSAAMDAVTVGDPMDPATRIGGLIDQKNKQRIDDRVTDAINAGATCLAGGSAVGDQTLYRPTLLSDVPHSSPLYHDEAFGPAAIIIPYETIDDAIAGVNDSTFGLQVGIYTDSIETLWRVYEECEVGGVIHDDVPSFRVDSMPYGGIKDSGLGREGLRYAIADMTEERVLVLRTR